MQHQHACIINTTDWYRSNIRAVTHKQQKKERLEWW
jgi:hypothetical protein